MRLPRVILALAAIASLVGAGLGAAPTAALANDRDEETYVMEDYRGFQSDSFKDSMKAAGIKAKLVTKQGKKGKAKSSWVVVSTKPAPGETVTIGKTKVSAVVRKEDETATGIKKRDTYLACSDRIKKELPGNRILGGWKVTASDKISTLTAPVGVKKGQEDRALTCSISMKGRTFHFESFKLQ